MSNQKKRPNFIIHFSKNQTYLLYLYYLVTFLKCIYFPIIKLVAH